MGERSSPAQHAKNSRFAVVQRQQDLEGDASACEDIVGMSSIGAGEV